jgi:AhpD family alkylhydroperoxidase
MGYAQDRMAEFDAVTKRMKSEFPAETRGFMGFVKKTEAGVNLPHKYKELIDVPLSVAAQCERCIACHVQTAHKLGASRNELVEAGFQAVVMHGGPAFMYMTRLLEAIDDFEAAAA